MTTPLRVAAFVTALVAAFAAAWGGGRIVGPLDARPAAGEMADHGGEEPHDDTAEPDAAEHGGHTSTVIKIFIHEDISIQAFCKCVLKSYIG